MAEDQAKRGVIGLANLGNTCFMNSALQALRHCPEWTLFCAQGKAMEHCQKRDTPHAKMLEAYIELLKSLWSGIGPAYVIPKGFVEALREVVKGTVYEDFTRRTPQDAHEFLIWLLDQMYMATQQEVSIQIVERPDIPKEIYQALGGWKSAFEKAYSPLTDLVFGMSRVQYECHTCKTFHTRWETFNTLKVQPCLGERGDPLSIYECLQKEFASEEIEDYACDKCAPNRTKATKHYKLWRLPKLLIVTYKRFTPMGTKLNFPVQLDASQHLNFEPLFVSESQESSKKADYSIFATVDHHGHHMGGHYTAQAKSPISGEWHFYNDDGVNSIDSPRFGSETYMVLLRQKGQ